MAKAGDLLNSIRGKYDNAINFIVSSPRTSNAIDKIISAGITLNHPIQAIRAFAQSGGGGGSFSAPSKIVTPTSVASYKGYMRDDNPNYDPSVVPDPLVHIPNDINIPTGGGIYTDPSNASLYGVTVDDRFGKKFFVAYDTSLITGSKPGSPALYSKPVASIMGSGVKAKPITSLEDLKADVYTNETLNQATNSFYDRGPISIPLNRYVLELPIKEVTRRKANTLERVDHNLDGTKVNVWKYPGLREMIRVYDSNVNTLPRIKKYLGDPNLDAVQTKAFGPLNRGDDGSLWSKSSGLDWADLPKSESYNVPYNPDPGPNPYGNGWFGTPNQQYLNKWMQGDEKYLLNSITPLDKKVYS